MIEKAILKGGLVAHTEQPAPHHVANLEIVAALTL